MKKTYYLKDLAHGRSGDKGDRSNICMFARKPEDFEFLKQELTAARVKEYFGDLVKGDVVRYEVDSLKGFNFVMDKALGGGATMSIRMDNLGKTMYTALLRMKLEREE
ncbi:AtuA-related protein [Youngiibacter multivorans]|uniref:AtuA-like ferredoxin-fold domain-containing protein n=1 Tax=Youngiibacter multivorans TaxID=937251 RepID=A0ABS4G7Y7_9CLOT|nr:hypothetical protein [Youngiibacter multivorans]MBP1920661.1 hypothetical protein [Youngiibacter multivorans]